MWEEVARQVVEKGGEIVMGARVVQIEWHAGAIQAVTTQDAAGGRHRYVGDYFFSSMPIKDLVADLTPAAPPAVKEISDHLLYRDFITVGLLLPHLKVRDDRDPAAALPRDNWIYIQEPDVLVGRLQLFNNWSPYLVADPSKAWIGMEYFCQEGDALWCRSDADMIALAAEELDRIGLIDRALVEDATVLRMPKTYPAYFGAYEHFEVIRQFLDSLTNLFPVGRNGMHKYNNQDHSMLTAMTAVDLILAHRSDKADLWSVNTEQEYHEDAK
jgi:protoporphyrinogen oxidase